MKFVMCGIAEIRGIKEIVKAMEYTKNIKLNLGGVFSEKNIEIKVKSYSGW
ncbi:MAG: hypothetical protein RBT59_10065 [Arcobacteraceae bacterium]|nr:hypothetical protein [Arcobacteraceae bacterium]